MENSILKSVKKVLGIDPTYTAFDLDILIHINSVFSTLNQIGLGPEAGLTIEDDSALWTAFIGTDARLSSVKTFVFLKVKMLFDPPSTSFLNEALNKQAEELLVRLSMYRESTAWTDPEPTVPVSGTILDGGTP